MQISWSLLCCTILQTAYNVDIQVVTLLHNTVDSVLCQISWSLLCCTILYAVCYVNRYPGPYFAAQYCRQCTMQISWSFLCCTTLQAEYYVDILAITLLLDIVESILCRYLCHYFATQYSMQRTIQIPWSLLCCTILQGTYNIDMLVVTFAVQYCRQRTMQISC